MENLTKYELKLIGGNRGIKNYQNMSKEKLWSAIIKSMRIIKNFSQNGLDWFTRMQNLSQNELEQITKMQNLSQIELEQIVKTRRIKNYKDMSREDLLIALLKLNQSHAELRRSKDNKTEIKKTKKISANWEIIFRKKK